MRQFSVFLALRSHSFIKLYLSRFQLPSSPTCPSLPSSRERLLRSQCRDWRLASHIFGLRSQTTRKILSNVSRRHGLVHLFERSACMGVKYQEMGPFAPPSMDGP